ncbi:MAG: methyl-accepting chemotaxis protein [Spirochaetales bacterium]
MKLRSVLTVSFVGIGLGVVALLAVIYLMFTNQDALNRAQEVRYLSYVRADELRQSSDDLTRLARTYVVTGDGRYEKMYWDVLDIRNGKKPRPMNYERIYWDLMVNYGEKPRPDDTTVALQDLMKQLGFTDEELGLLTEAQKNSDGLVTTETVAMNAIKGLYNDGNGNYTVEKPADRDLAIRIMHDVQYHTDKAKIVKPIDQFFAKLDQRTAATVANFKTTGDVLLVSAIALTVLLLVLIVLIGFTVTRKVSRSLGEDPAVIESITDEVALGNLEVKLHAGQTSGVYSSVVRMVASLKRKADVLTAVSGGDLTMESPLESDRDGLGQALQAMIRSLNHTLGRIHTNVEQVNSGASQVADASQSLSQGATEQASSMEQITSSLTEINSQAKRNMEGALQVNQLATSARDSAAQGNTQMQKVVAAMAEINKSAEGIKKIAKAIDDIAFQTSLLSLNANVEAARAGKYGKGFAVVADEVRSLAVRSGNSVKEATELVEQALRNIENGNKLAAVTAKQIDGIVGIASKVAEIASEVSAASREQSGALDQIAAGLEQIDRVTQSNTASAEESASAAEELAGQAADVRSMLAQFRLGVTA